MKKCLICSYETEEFLDLGKQPISDAFLLEEQFKNEYFYNLKVGFCSNCKMVQILEQPNRQQIFHENYSFLSSTSNYMQKHFKLFANTTIKNQSLTKESFIVEIGCNDGILIQNFTQNNIPSLGVEPSNNVADIARKKGIDVVTEFFDEDLVDKIINKYTKADLIISANVISHIPYANSIFKGVKKLLKDDGVFIFEDRYAKDIINSNSFDQIYDEHTFLFYVISCSFLANMHGLEIIDVEYQIVHGGSMRYTLAHKNSKPISDNVYKQIKEEEDFRLNDISTYKKFANNIPIIQKGLMDLLNKLKNDKKTVVAYGATAKSATITNLFKIDTQYIKCIYDNTPNKHNKFSPGMHIPVISYEEFRASKPDYVLLFAWNHAKEIMEKEKEYMESNNIKWIMYVPNVKIV